MAEGGPRRRHWAIGVALAAAIVVLALALRAGLASGGGETYAPAFTDKPTAAKPEYVFAIHPLHNPERLFAVYGPIVDYLNARMPEAHFRLEASRNYAEFEKKLYARQFSFALPNPYQTVESLAHGYHVFGKMGDDENFRGLILVRRDGGIAQVADLKGKTVCYPAPTALAATMLPQYYLHTHGLDVRRDIRNLYVGSQESSIMNVYLGFAAAGATWPVPWRTFQKEHPAEAGQLVVKWQTETLPNNGLVVRDDVPAAVRERVAGLLFSLHEEAAGRALLEAVPLSRFEAATDATYAPVRAWLRRFVAEVRPVEE